MIVYVEPRVCVDCGLTKPGDCFPVLNRRKDGSRGRRSHCNGCRYQRDRSANLRRARRQRERLMATAEGREKMRRTARESKRRRRRVSPEQHEREKAISRRWHHDAYHGDPEYRERVLVKQKARRAAVRRQERRLRRQRQAEERVRVRPEPILGYVAAKAEELIALGEADPRGGEREVAARAGVSARLFSYWRDGERRPRLLTVDQILTRLGEPYLLEVLYPEVDELLGVAE